jgi:hypothetical protein
VSQIDQSLDEELRSALLSEVRWYLPALLSAATVERSDPVLAAVDLIGLRPSDLQRVLAVHALLSDPVRAFISALPEGTRQPAVSSIRPRVAGRVITSGIDWAATIRRRATSGPLDPEWVARPARRLFDVPENQALAWLIGELQRRASAVRQPPGQGSPWQREIRESRAAVHRYGQLAWLENVQADWPGETVYERLQADRRGFYRTKVAPAARFLRKYLSPSVQDVVDAICDRYFEPTQDWKLFEIAILLRISSALAEVGERTGSFKLIAGGKKPFASYRLPSGRVVRLWYQAWPPSSGNSELLDAVAHYRISDGGLSRPDIVVEFIDNGEATRLILLEVKASSSASYLASGFAQLLSYLRERPALTTISASGWLVAPRKGSPREPEDRALWLVSADHVASAVVTTAKTNSPIEECNADSS